MGTNYAPLLADLFLYSYGNEFLNKLINEGKRKLARKFSLSYRNTDDLISFNNKRFNDLQKSEIAQISGKIYTLKFMFEKLYVYKYLILAAWKDISQHCDNQSGYIMTVSLDAKDHLLTDYLISIQFRWSNLK